MKQQNKKYFSIFEMLISLTIVTILASLIATSFIHIRDEAKRTTCLNQLKQIQQMVEVAKKDLNMDMPKLDSFSDFSFLEAYIDEENYGIMICPSDSVRLDLGLNDLSDTSYFVVPTKKMVESEDAMDMSTLAIEEYMVIYDKLASFHDDLYNIVYLHGGDNNLAGIARSRGSEPTEPLTVRSIPNEPPTVRSIPTEAPIVPPTIIIPPGGGNTIVAGEDMDVVLELVGSGYSSNTVKSNINLDGAPMNWLNEDGDEHTDQVVGVEGLNLSLTISEGASIQVNASAAHDSNNLQNSDNLQVYRDGDYVSNLDGYSGQLSVKDFLADYIDENGRVTLEDNQVIFLMELGTTNTNKAYFDMQDVVVVATFTAATKNELEEMVEETIEK
ncbi:type II secretion system protein [Lentisphaera profundi]|uniref:Type II secretion system protein n=1 Tax=Lentisphaera profundi TaxID=1658616 RepID=A0ABY7VQ67_9BACT|nr:type II secretion system protein [Lentisphaera profundi]WDE95857.1 type II secretion system protein [Lentisphaera profundi]